MLRVLCATDLSPNADLSLSRAISLAAENGASLRVIHAVEGVLSETHDQAIRRQLESRCRAETPPDLHWDISLVCGHPVEAILEASRTACADLIVLGAHSRMRMRDAWFGTTASHVLRRADAPVLVVRSPVTTPYRRVVAAVDDTTVAEKVLRLAARLATSQEVIAVHAFQVPLEAYVGGRALHEEIERDHRRVVEEIVERVAPGVGSVRFHEIVRQGDVIPVIEAAVEEARPDLLVLGTRGHEGLARLLFDSIAEEALAYFELDMLLVRTGEGDVLTTL